MTKFFLVCAGKQKGGDVQEEDDEAQEVAALLKRIKNAHPPPEILKVSACTDCIGAPTMGPSDPFLRFSVVLEQVLYCQSQMLPTMSSCGGLQNPNMMLVRS